MQSTQKALRILLILMAVCLAGTAGWAQVSPTGSITGRVTGAGEPLPGVMVRAEGPNLQQPRQVITQASGDFLIRLLPPGNYRLTFDLEGFETQVRRLDVALAQVERVDVDLSLETVSDEIVVTGAGSSISSSTTLATTYEQELVEKLPSGRTITDAVALAPGTAATGPGGQISISGGQSYENLYLINGVAVNDNIRGQPSDLFIEDAIQETTVLAAGVSAEYGRFAGGVVSTVTRSGGNDFHGSLRDSLTNEKWSSESPFGEPREDAVNDVFEATLGGYLWRDRLWFFTAGRLIETDGLDQTLLTNIQYPTGNEERRIEGKLTFAFNASHQLLVSALDLSDEVRGSSQGFPLDLGAVDEEAQLPQDSFSAIYTGILSRDLFFEAQYGERSQSFEDFGGTDNDPRSGTPITASQLGGARFHQPTFCGNCPNPTTRETETAIAKASYFLGTAGGSHDLVFGLDTFNDITSGDNTQSATNFSLWSSTALIRGQEVYPVLNPFPFSFDSFIIYWPILENNLGTDFVSNSIYANDRWQIDEHWSVNLGLRWDQNDGVDSGGNQVADDSALSPRLGVSYDSKGDGDLVWRATYGRYVTRLANTIADSGSTAGEPALFAWFYAGPAINTDPNVADPITSDDALDIVFDWFDSIGGIDNQTFLLAANIPGVTQQIDGSLDSPIADEITVGFSKRLGNRGLVRTDYVHRDYGDLYFSRVDTSTGTVTDANGLTFDLALIGNDDNQLERVYDGLQTSFHYRLNDRLNLGGNWTWSHARGNFDGETAGSGPVAGSVGEYPEYKAFPENNPRRDLLVDQRHNARVWLIWDALSNERQQVSVSLMQTFLSGKDVPAVGAVATGGLVENPGYLTPPNTVSYYFDLDAFQTGDVTSTDLAINYSFYWTAWKKRLEVFVQPEVLNVFDEDELVGAFNTNDVQTAANNPGLQPFDPFTEEPVRGVHWDLGPNFGQPQSQNSFQQPRTFRLSLGVRF